MGLLALRPIRKEGVLRTFIALKNPSPWPGSNPKLLGPVESILTTTPSRRPFYRYYCPNLLTVLKLPVLTGTLSTNSPSKAGGPCHKILLHVKDPLRYFIY
jgi:hypothetical protein